MTISIYFLEKVRFSLNIHLLFDIIPNRWQKFTRQLLRRAGKVAFNRRQRRPAKQQAQEGKASGIVVPFRISNFRFV